MTDNKRCIGRVCPLSPSHAACRHSGRLGITKTAPRSPPPLWCATPQRTLTKSTPPKWRHGSVSTVFHTDCTTVTSNIINTGIILQHGTGSLRRSVPFFVCLRFHLHNFFHLLVLFFVYNSGDLDENGTFEAVTSSEFSIECGCSSGTTTDGEDGIPAPAPTPPLGSDSCGDGDAFTIISDEFPETEGCYRDSGRTEEGESLYTLTGTPFLGQQMVYASVEDDTDAVWCLKYITAQHSTAIWTCQLFHPRTTARHYIAWNASFGLFFPHRFVVRGGGGGDKAPPGGGEIKPPPPQKKMNMYIFKIHTPV